MPETTRASVVDGSSDVRDGGRDHIHLSILTDIGLEFDCPAESEDERTTIAIAVSGPRGHTIGSCGRRAALNGGCRRPRQSVPQKYRRRAGIPILAHTFAYIYPWVELEEALDQLDFAKDSWAFALLIGGFAYFDVHGRLLQVNAITFAPSPQSLMLIGPFACSEKAFKSLQKQGRLETICDGTRLKAAGFHSCGWVHPSEDFDGAPLLASSDHASHPHGAMVYTRGVDGSRHQDAQAYMLITPADPDYIPAGVDAAASTRKPRSTETVAQRLSDALSSSISLSADAIRKKNAAMRLVGEREDDEEGGKESLLNVKAMKQLCMKVFLAAAFIGLGMFVFTRPFECAADTPGTKPGWNFGDWVLKTPVEAGNGTLIWSVSIQSSEEETASGSGESSGESSTVPPPPPPPTTCQFSQASAIYFIMTTISTVGYGDITPPPHLRAFTGVYILVGVLVVFQELGAIMDLIMKTIEKSILQLACICLPRGDPEVKQQQGALHAQWRVQPAWQYYLQQLGLLFLLGLGVTQLFAAWVFTQYVDGLDYATALWHCWVTSTTVGYGDVALPNEPSRLVGAVHILVSVSWLASLSIRVPDVIRKRRFIVARANLVQKQLDPGLIDLLDRDGRGSVDKVEFVIGLLSVLGLELCGEPLSFENDVQPLLERFDALDSDSSGALSREDLDYMIKESRRKSIRQGGYRPPGGEVEDEQATGPGWAKAQKTAAAPTGVGQSGR